MAGRLAREAAYDALLASWKEERFIGDSLKQWKERENPAAEDFGLAQQIANGACRMRLALDYIASHLTEKGKLSLKRKERALLHTALYQHCFMSRVPLYAIASESVEIAKRRLGEHFAKFLNAILRNIKTVPLPEGDSVPDLSVRFSFPEIYVEKLLGDYGAEAAKTILEAENQNPVIMARDRSKKFPESMRIIENASDLEEAAASPGMYIQNATPAALMNGLAEGAAPPKTILDLCSSPGGKLIAAHDLFPHGELFANDVSEAKLLRLSENLSKFQISARLTCGLGENYPSGRLFDLILIDAPCSNSGVFHKRPEARWRLTEENLNDLKKTQGALIRHALNLLSPNGEIWYMTCSILKEENEALIASFPLYAREQIAILPDKEGRDGGFGAALQKNPIRSEAK